MVAGLALLMLLVALNLSGVFEVGDLGCRARARAWPRRGGMAGAFFTGVLAVVVAAPCTAPFMAARPGLGPDPAAGRSALLVFLALGLGFAAPFLAAGLRARPAAPPAQARAPGWTSCARLLAFPMYGAAAWLVWVLTLQAGAMALAAPDRRRRGRRRWPPGSGA